MTDTPAVDPVLAQHRLWLAHLDRKLMRGDLTAGEHARLVKKIHQTFDQIAAMPGSAAAESECDPTPPGPQQEQARIQATDEPKYLIWSNQRGMWWRPAQHGYTRIIEAAGRYSRKEAEKIVARSTIGGVLKHRYQDFIDGRMYYTHDEAMVPAPRDTPEDQ